MLNDRKQIHRFILISFTKPLYTHIVTRTQLLVVMRHQIKDFPLSQNNKLKNKTLYTKKQITLVYFLWCFTALRSSRSCVSTRFDDEPEDGFADVAEPPPPPCRTSFKKSLNPNGSSSR
jgi:hypothetical protein